jgi:hypothetical protein
MSYSVREPEEFADGHLPGAVNIPRGLLEFEVDGHPRLGRRGSSSRESGHGRVARSCGKTGRGHRHQLRMNSGRRP